MTTDLEREVGAFIDHYSHHRYHERLNNLTPTSIYHGSGHIILLKRKRIMRETIQKRRLIHHVNAA